MPSLISPTASSCPWGSPPHIAVWGDIDRGDNHLSSTFHRWAPVLIFYAARQIITNLIDENNTHLLFHTISVGQVSRHSLIAACVQATIKAWARAATSSEAWMESRSELTDCWQKLVSCRWGPRQLEVIHNSLVQGPLHNVAVSFFRLIGQCHHYFKSLDLC